MSVDIVLAKFQSGDSVDFDPAFAEAVLARHGVAPAGNAGRIETDDGWVDVSWERHEHNGTPYLLFNRPSGTLVWDAIFDVATVSGLSVLMPDVAAVCVFSIEVADEHAAHPGDWDDVFLLASPSDLVGVLQGDQVPYRPI
jgi:hypothetical protein